MEENDDGTVTVEFSEIEDLDEDSLNEVKEEHYDNLVHKLSEQENLDLAHLIISNVENDQMAQAEWLRTIEMGFDLLGIKLEEKNEPFEGACSAQHPLLMESAVKFQSKASNELLPANGPVKTKILGDVTPEKEQQASRVKAHMNYQITEEMTEFYTDTERMLLYISLVGSGFKKTYYNAHLERPCSEFVPADQFIVPNSASDLYRAERYTHILYKMAHELDADCAAGLYAKPEEGLPAPEKIQLSPVQKKTHELMGMEISIGERDNVHTIYEQHITMFIEGVDELRDKRYKLASPYIVTVEANAGRVIGLRRNWKEGDVKRKKKVQFTHYTFVPSFNFYGYGFLHLLGNLQLTLTACMRSLVDAGQFANLQGGFKLKGVRILDNGEPISPGQFKDVESSLQDVNKAIMTLPFKEPSNVLYQMLNFIDAKGQKFADSSEQVIADSTNYGPVGTTMALLEASNKFFSAIHKRLHAALKSELKIIADINSETLPDNMQYNLENETMSVSRKDYGPIVDVVPVSDPNISSSAHRMAKAQTLLEFAMRAPELHDMREVLKHVYINMEYANVDKILPTPEEAQQSDPVTDISNAVQGKPIKAFQGQDHKAHITLKQAFLQDPMSGANPLMQKASIALQANIQEHMLMQFTEALQAEAQNTPQTEEQMTPEQIMAQAAGRIAQMNQENLQNQLEEAKKSSKDQIAHMLAQAELMDTQIQARKQKFDESYKIADLELKKERLDMDKVKEINRADEKRLDMTRKDADIVTTKGLDAMIHSMSQSYDAQQKKDLKAMELAAQNKPVDGKDKS
jgi:chaperonin GroES